jgi:hypothetical protein
MLKDLEGGSGEPGAPTGRCLLPPASAPPSRSVGPAGSSAGTAPPQRYRKLPGDFELRLVQRMNALADRHPRYRTGGSGPSSAARGGR